MSALPRLKKIYLKASNAKNLADRLSILWGCSSSGLESITICVQTLPENIPNLDSVFCGITKEQAGFYESLSAEDLRKKTLVPEGPSILSLKTLKKFRMEFHGGCSHDERGNGAPFHPCLFTHVTTALAFEAMPELEVKIEHPSSASVDLDLVECETSGSHFRRWFEDLAYGPLF
jgi:hypothetical protein